jgi:hypothetical protein
VGLAHIEFLITNASIVKRAGKVKQLCKVIWENAEILTRLGLHPLPLFLHNDVDFQSELTATIVDGLSTGSSCYEDLVTSFQSGDSTAQLNMEDCLRSQQSDDLNIKQVCFDKCYINILYFSGHRPNPTLNLRSISPILYKNNYRMDIVRNTSYMEEKNL